MGLTNFSYPITPHIGACACIAYKRRGCAFTGYKRMRLYAYIHQHFFFQTALVSVQAHALLTVTRYELRPILEPRNITKDRFNRSLENIMHLEFVNSL